MECVLSLGSGKAVVRGWAGSYWGKGRGRSCSRGKEARVWGAPATPGAGQEGVPQPGLPDIGVGLRAGLTGLRGRLGGRWHRLRGLHLLAG